MSGHEPERDTIAPDAAPGIYKGEAAASGADAAPPESAAPAGA